MVMAQVHSRPAEIHIMHAMRGIAAAAVLVYHGSELVTGRLFCQSGYLAVDLFFVLSGYVIARAYEAKLRGRALGLWAFMRRRFARLYPLYILGLAIALLSIVGFHLVHYQPPSLRLSAASAVISLFYLPVPPLLSIGAGNPYPLNNAYWSLGLEVLGNALYAAGIFRLRNKGLALLVGLGGAWLAYAGWAHGSLNGGAEWRSYGLGYLRFWYSFFVGVLIFRLTRERQIKAPPLFWLVLAGLCGILAYGPPLAWRAVYDLAVVLLGWPLMVIVAAQVATPARMAWLSHQVGEASYALYATHIPLIGLWLAMVYPLTGLGWRLYSASAFWAVALGILALSVVFARLDAVVRRRLATYPLTSLNAVLALVRGGKAGYQRADG